MKVIKHCRDLLYILIGFNIASIMKMSKRNKDIWLVSERKNEAEDNGYHFYKYVREKHPEQKIYYLIDKKSSSYKKIEKYKTVIQYNSLQHYIYYFLSNKHLSAFQFFGVPETPFLWYLEEKEIIKKKKIFLQHGITKEMLTFLLYKNTKYNLFICGAKPEYEYIKENYGYPEQSVKYLGFCRFDNLHNNEEKNQILIMPTWRHWFGMTNSCNEAEKRESEKFIESEYFKEYSNLINNNTLHKILLQNNTQLIFYPHPEMQRFINKFRCKCSNIKIARREEYNLQQLIKESKLIITDYSSIAFDCAYMRKNMIYYQFDQQRYYSEHFQKGYFDCERDGFGPVVKKQKDLIKLINDDLVGISDNLIYKNRAVAFFPLYDNLNCQRHYEEIIKL